MAREDITMRVEDGRFDDLAKGGLLGKLLNVVHNKVQGAVPECILCDGPVVHPIDIDHLVDRYTRSETTDGVAVPVNIRGIKMITRWCRTCSDAVFDQACRALGLVPVTDVKRRLEVTREGLAATLAQREAEVNAKSGRYASNKHPEHASCSSVFVSRRDVGVKKARNKAARDRHLAGVRSGRRPIEGEVTRKLLGELRIRIREFERLRVDGIPDENVPGICEKTKELLLAHRYVPLAPIAARIKAEASLKAGHNVPDSSKSGKRHGRVK